MNKLQMAHEYALKMLENLNPMQMEKPTRDGIVYECFELADAMQAEADKRAEQKRKEIREMLNADNTFIEKEGQHFDDVEWQPDWGQAPENMTHWGMELGSAYWLKEEGNGLFCKIGKASLFGYTGNQQGSLRKRP